MNTAIRKLALPVAFLVVGLPVGIWAVTAMGGHKKTPEESSFRPINPRSSPHQERAAQPRWEQVTTLAGAGSADRSFAVAKRAIQWKADWSCQSGEFSMSVGRHAEEEGKALAATNCPDAGEEISVGNGGGNLSVSASAPWRVTVRQQVDTALEEPPLPDMSDASLLARGRVHPIQKQGEGTLSLYQLNNGRLALRFEDFYTAASPGLEVWLSRAPSPKSTLNAREASYSNAGALRSTLGSYNQVLPRGIRRDRISSIVIWCPTVQIAFSAAPLKA